MIQQKAIHVETPKLQWMLLIMQKYDYTIQYNPGKEMVLANCLSCFPSHNNSLPIHIMQNVQHVQLSNVKLGIIEGSIECDPVYSTIYCLTLEIGLSTSSKSPRLPDTSGEAWTNFPLMPAYSSRGQGYAFPRSCLMAPLQTSMEHIKGLIGCKFRWERLCIGLA